MMRPVTERMADALSDLRERTGGRRRPKVFYLRSDDWRDFIATNPPTARFAFGNNPTVWRDEPIFEGSPVRVSRSPHSRLYDHTTTGRALPP